MTEAASVSGGLFEPRDQFVAAVDWMLMLNGGMRRWIMSGAGTVVVLAGVCLAAPPVAGSWASSPTGLNPPADSALSAADLAAAAGEPVVLEELTTETSLVSAMPNGEFRAVLSASPVRKSEGGRWQDLDASLVRQADGTFEPRTPLGEVVLSGGGPAGSLLGRFAVDGHGYEVKAPFALPAPSVVGDTALYADVLPGVDLVSVATTAGFSHNWVVKNRAAASDPRVRSLKLDVAAPGLAPVTEQGGISLVDDRGIRVMWMPAPTMWDSRASSAAATESPVQAVQEGPDFGDRVAAVAATATRTSVVLTPSLALLDDPQATFPIVIDPVITYPKVRGGWTAVWDNFPTKSFWQTEHSLGAGYEGYEQFKHVRSYFQFDTRAVRGKHIIAAELNVRQIHAASCTARATDVYRTGSISTSTTWNNQPTRYAFQSSSSSTAGCGSGTAMVGWDVRQGVEQLAIASAATGTFTVRAKDETDKIAWKQFDDDEANIVVTYVSKPNKPTGLFVKSGSKSYPCGASEAAATVVGSTSITVGATVSNGDGSSASLKGVFRRRDMALTTDYVDAGGSDATSNPGTSSRTWAVANAHTYRFKVKTRVAWTYNGSSAYLDSAFNDAWCYFRIDTTAPSAPIVTPDVDGTPTDTADDDFAECATPNDPGVCPVKGEVHQAGSLRIQAAKADGTPSTDGTSYHWRLNGAASVSLSTTAGAAKTIQVTPDREVNTLEVWTEDGANHGVSNFFTFRVAPVAVDVRWSFDDTAAPGADSGVSPDSPLDLGTASTTQNGRVGTALALNGSIYGTSATGEVGTTGDFTAAAWVRLGGSGPVTFLTAPTSTGNAFELGYEPNGNLWTAGRQHMTGVNRAASSTGVRGAWTHVAATFRSSTRTVALFVDGRASGTTTYSADGWVNTGGWRVGCGNIGGASSGCLTGSVDEVRLYDVVLSQAEVLDLANPIDDTSNPIAASAALWAMDDLAGSASATEPRFGAHLQLAGGASLGATSDMTRNALLLSGSSTQQAQVPGQVINSGGSFSIAAHVRASELTSSMVIAQQSGANRAAWTLGFEPAAGGGGRWVFERAASDAAGSSVSQVQSRLDQAVAGEWTHLVAVFDARSEQLALFVNGRKVETDPEGSIGEIGFATPWVARGLFEVGNDIDGQPAPFKGELDQVELFAGVMGDGAAADLFNQV